MKKRLLWEIVVLVAAVATAAVLSSLVTARVIKSEYETTTSTAPAIVESYEVSDPVKLDLGSLDDITSITITLGNGTKTQVEGEERDRIIEFLKNLTMVKLRDSKGIYGWDYLVVLYSEEERRQIVSFIYEEAHKHPEWVMYGDYIYYLENTDWDAVEDLLSPYFE